ncbi:hypothetical protein ALC56_06120, partial [Trachymyrmex septentrionalis]
RRSLFRPLAPIKPKACCMHTQEGKTRFPSTLVPPVYRPRLSLPLLYSVLPPTTPHVTATYICCVYGRTAGHRKARTIHKYTINAAQGKREIIRAPFNLRYTFGKDELNLTRCS